jgi:hypothetical protein
MVTESNSSASQTAARKAYQKPTLTKAAVLSAVTAAGDSAPISGATECWVARAAFGEADIRWMIFRAWLVDDAPAWFRRLYIRHGESIGNWLAGRESARLVVRALMVPAVNGKLRGWQRGIES